MCPPPYPCPHAANSRQHRLTCAAGLNTAVSVDFLGFFLEYNHQLWLYDCLLCELRKRLCLAFLSATSRRIGGRLRARAGRVGAIGVDAATRRRRLFVLVCGLFCAVLCEVCPWCVWARVGGRQTFCFCFLSVFTAVARTRVRTYACTCKFNVCIESICDSYVCLSLPHSPHDLGRWPGPIGAVPRRLKLGWRAAAARRWPCAGAGGGHRVTFDMLDRVYGLPQCP